MVEGMDGGQFLGQESRLGGRNDEGNFITILESPCPSSQIPHVASAKGVTDCFLGHGDAPSG